MKRIGNLINEKTITIDFCKRAILDAAKHKHKKQFVRRILKKLDFYAKILRDLVLNAKFVPSEYDYEERIEYGKKRRLQKPKFFPDQAVHHILIKLVQDKIYKRIDPHAVASLPGRGQGAALKAINKWLSNTKKSGNIKYCGKGDIKKCFDSITSEVQMKLWNRVVKDRIWLLLMERIAYSCESLPLGNYCSAWTLNLLLKDLDNAIRSFDKVTYYIRYMDDFVFFTRDKKRIKPLKEIIEQELIKLGLQLKENYQVFKFQDRGLDFIGYRFFPSHTALRRRNFYKVLRQAKKLSKNKFYTVDDCQSFMSRFGQLKHCHARYILDKIIKLVDIGKMKQILRLNSWKQLPIGEIDINKLHDLEKRVAYLRR